ncbi:hypothetical protein VaNZ11_005875 [Volvox africanus]|uniref:Uncharacterized protein n=1 Tax=Volvox africanus TaxID=51714 RepID=A0ABQ5RZG1_9CHLO|nr:hypothetical protein VaNZ11_005875 [Volvox africanus]
MYSPTLPTPPKSSSAFRVRPSNSLHAQPRRRLAMNRNKSPYVSDLSLTCKSGLPICSGSGSMETFTRAGSDRVLDAVRKAVGRVPDGLLDASAFQQQSGSLNTMSESSPGGNGMGGHGAAGLGGGQDADGCHEDDPYAAIRPDGGHAMRWWTYAFAAILAVGGLLTTIWTGLLEPLQLGWAAAAMLVLSGAAMSRIDSAPGALGVKLAWAVCAVIVLKESARSRLLNSPGWSALGLTALATCMGYMLTDMSALDEVALPTNPGSVFKSPDIADRSRVWQEWGYGQVQMRV